MTVSVSAEVPSKTSQSGRSLVSDPEAMVWLFLAYTKLGKELKHQVKNNLHLRSTRKKKSQLYTPVWKDPTETSLSKSSLHSPEVQGQAPMTQGEREVGRGVTFRGLSPSGGLARGGL